MFYSVDLLTLKRNGKFSKCWLAANLTRKAFYSKFRQPTINAISIANTSDIFISIPNSRELMDYITTYSPELRFSLYLSSQLMFGLTRIYYYQTDACLKYHIKLWISTNALSKTTNARDEVERDPRSKPTNSPVIQRQLPPLELFASGYPTKNLVDDVNKITLIEPNISIHKSIVRDVDDNFGALTAEQLEQLLDPNGLCFDSSQSRQIRVSPELENGDISYVFTVPQSIRRVTSQDAIIDIGEIPKEDNSLGKIPTIPEIIEQPGLSTAVYPHNGRFGTPTKHKLSTSPGIETPTKKRRGLESEYDTGATIPVPFPYPNVTEQTSALVFPETPSINISLESLTSSVFQRPLIRKKSRKVLFDIHKQLPVPVRPVNKKKDSEAPIELLKKAISRETAAELFINPSTRKVWSKTLLVNYQMMLVNPMPQSLVDRKRRTKPKASTPLEAIRGPDTSGAERTGELSDQEIHKTATSEDTSNRTKTLEQVLAGENSRLEKLPPLADGTSSTFVETVPELPADIPQLTHPDISSPSRMVPDTIENGVEHERPWSTISSLAHASLEKSEGNSDAPFIRSFGRTWTKLDILGSLELLWLEKSCVEFRDICPPSYNTRKDAGQIFVLFLELHRLKEVRLEQTTPYHDIGIRKYVENL